MLMSKGKLLTGSFFTLLTLSLSMLISMGIATADTTPPVIIHEPATITIPAGSPHTISAEVTDDELLDAGTVKIGIKSAGADDFEFKAMLAGELNAFTYTFESTELVPPAVEYYITAVDMAGNSQSSGFSYFPHRLNVDAAEITTTAAAEETAESVAGIPRPVLYVAGALLLAGIVAGLSGDEGDSTESFSFAVPVQ